MKNLYLSSLIALGVLIALGTALQLGLGSPDVTVLAWPVSIIAAALIVLIIVGLTIYYDKPFFKWLMGIPFTISLLAAMLLVCLVAGVVPQHEMQLEGLLANAGVYKVISSWPFVLLYFVMLITLGCITASAIAKRVLRRWVFIFNHLGLWLVLLGAGIGNADFRELKVRIYEGEIAVHATGKTGLPIGMPFGIRLDDFRMEEYPNKWGIVDVRTGKFQPEGKPRFYETEREAFASGLEDGQHLMVASPPAEPSYFGSDITIIPTRGEQIHTTIEVNRPYRSGKWAVYQYGYDSEEGAESKWSVLQLVCDPWLPVVYAGIAMLALGALTMLYKKRRKTNGMA